MKISYRKQRIAILAVFVFSIMAFCTGCSNERLDKQLEVRTEGLLLMEQGRYEEALELFEETLELALGKIGEVERDICYYQAEAKYKLGDIQGAIDTYTALIHFDDDAKAHYLRGNLYYKLGQETDALADYAAAIEQSPKEYELYIGVYEALAAHGKEMEAQEYLNKALEIEGDKAYDQMQKGRINYLLGELDTAVSLLETAAEGEQMLAYYYLAEISYELGDIGAAKTNLAVYAKSEEANSFNLFSIANHYIGKKHYDMAIECLNAALELEQVPNKQIILKTLVIAYEYTYDFASAKSVMAEYIKAYPEDEEALREYTFLDTR